MKEISNLILTLRDEKVILDFNLAKLYGIENRVLKQSVRRNKDRFPVEFMFNLNKDEVEHLISQFVISNNYANRARPMAFTESGVAMLSSVLKSKSHRDQHNDYESIHSNS